MNLLEKLKQQIGLAKSRPYFTGAQIAEETLKLVETNGVKIFEVSKKYYGRDGKLRSVITRHFMKKADAGEHMESEVDRLCGLNSKYESYRDGSSSIEIEKNDRTIYIFEVEEKHLI